MQREIVNGGKLLDEKGNLVERGYARSLIKEYNRKDIKAPKWRIKEWDYYLVYNNDYGIALTLDDNSYMGMISVSVIDFKNAKELTVSPIEPFTGGKTGMPASSKTGDAVYKTKKAEVEFLHIPNGRNLKVKMKKFYNNQDFECDLMLTDEPAESMVIVTPFNKKKYFYYNQKIVGFKTSGYFKVGDFVYDFDKENTIGLLDWGRGVWTYKNRWYWGAGAGIVDGHMVGFNIGYGFGDTSAASENVVFYDGILHKLEDVSFNIPVNEKGKKEYTKPWTFTSSDKRFEMEFTPIIDRASCTSVVVICSDQHQVFGKFNGKIILDGGKEIVLNDFLGFAEDVFNKW